MTTVWHRLVKSQTGRSDEALIEKDAQLEQRYDSYMKHFDPQLSQHFDHTKDQEFAAKRATNGIAQDMVNAYYDIVTDFYEYGWGQSFHFAPLAPGEGFEASIARHEYSLAHKMGIQSGDRVLDVGCGVGGPLRNIARFTGAHITGLNNNGYQVKRAIKLNEQAFLQKQTHVVQGDFMNIPFPSNSFDHVYAIEATCHAPDRTGCYTQIFNALKPGGHFGLYEWCMTDKYNEKDPIHNQIRHGIEEGNSLPRLTHYTDILSHLKAAGFEILEHYDVAEKADAAGETGWYCSFKASYSPSQFKHTRLGRACTQLMVDILETLRIAPKGTSGTHTMLTKTADALYESGRTGIFTPMYYVLVRKPSSKQ